MFDAVNDVADRADPVQNQHRHPRPNRTYVVQPFPDVQAEDIQHRAQQDPA